MNITPIAYIENDYTDSFGIPRQSGLVKSVKSKIVFTKEFRDKNALRGIEQYSHIWLIWGFSDNVGKKWSPTVRPPKLGGNKRVGVFATRSPFRPNSLGLTNVSLLETGENEKDGMFLIVGGADLKNNTPIYDIKPYIPYADSVPDAEGGFSQEHKDEFLEVEFSDEVKLGTEKDFTEEIKEILSLDPVPQYKTDNKIYGVSIKNREIKFLKENGKITVISVEKDK